MRQADPWNKLDLPGMGGYPDTGQAPDGSVTLGRVASRPDPAQSLEGRREPGGIAVDEGGNKGSPSHGGRWFIIPRYASGVRVDHEAVE
jgi:hypothetical protein